MKRKEEERLLIDRYLSNSLSGTELKDFMDRLESDADFRNEVSFQNLIAEAIRHADQQRMETAIIEAINYKKPLVPLGLRLIVLFLLITVSGILLWQFSGTTDGIKKPKLSFNIFTKKTAEKTAVKSGSKKEIAVVPDTAAVTEEIPGEPVVEADSLGSMNLSEEEVIVKKDQLLMTVPMKPIPLDEADSEQSSLAQSAADKLNPAAGLPDETAIQEYQVEFWISPVNYRGYKLANDKLILFGIEEPDAVRLYTFSNNLLMKYGKDYYKLQPVSDFVSFLIMKENSLPAALK